MLKYLKYNQKYVQILALWFVAGFLFSPLLYVLVPIIIFTLSGKNKYLTAFLGFWVMLVFSDAKIGFGSAATVKILYILILLYFIVDNKKILQNNHIYKAFIPFIIFSIISLISSPILFTAIEKTTSYFLIVFIVPPLVSFLLKTNKQLFLLGLVYTGTLVLLMGFVMAVVAPDSAFYAERFSGLFGNPNGLGIFTILFTMLWKTIKFYYPKLFTKKDKYLINTLIIIAIIMAASRGALLSVFMFYALDYSVRKKNPFIIVGVIIVFISFLFIDNIVSWLYSIGLGEYLRAQTLENGSGRVVAYEFSLEQIKLAPLFGKGFGYSEYWFHREDIELVLNLLNHQGNTHNTYLTVLMDTGFFGLFAFIFAWGIFFSQAIKQSPFGVPVLIIILFSSNVEAWLAASLNPFTIILIIILTLLTNKNFTNSKEIKR